MDTGRITLKGDGKISTTDTLRHELMHANDKKRDAEGGIINGVDFDKIQKSKEFRNEYLNAGVPADLADYAKTNKSEFLAVAAQGQFSKYSEKFKNVLVKLGMPEWVFKLEVTNAETIKLAKSNEAKSVKKH